MDYFEKLQQAIKDNDSHIDDLNAMLLEASGSDQDYIEGCIDSREIMSSILKELAKNIQ